MTSEKLLNFSVSQFHYCQNDIEAEYTYYVLFEIKNQGSKYLKFKEKSGSVLIIHMKQNQEMKSCKRSQDVIFLYETLRKNSNFLKYQFPLLFTGDDYIFLLISSINETMHYGIPYKL